jgi:hypothetical protein
MEDPSELFAGTAPEGHVPDCEDHLPEDWQLARTARLNLHLIHRNRSIENVLKMVAEDLLKPIAIWKPGERLVLPSAGRAGTIILHDVGALSRDDQQQLLQWLESAANTQVVSTTQSPLLPRVQNGRFDDRLYYRLNTVCVDCDRVAAES